MADPFAMNDGSDDGFESVSKADLLQPEMTAGGAAVEQPPPDSTTTTTAVVPEEAPAAAAVKEEDVDLLLTTADDDPTDSQSDDAKIKSQAGMQGEHDLISTTADDDMNNAGDMMMKQSVDDDIDNSNDNADSGLILETPVGNDVLSDHMPTQAAAQEPLSASFTDSDSLKEDLLLDFGGGNNSAETSEPSVKDEEKVEEPTEDQMEDLTPVASEQEAFNAVEQFETREATPPPSPSPSPELTPVQEAEPEAESDTKPIPEPEPVAVPVPEPAPIADSTTPSLSTATGDDGPVKMPKAATIPATNRAGPHGRSSGEDLPLV